MLEVLKNMEKVAGFVDCVSLPCPDLLTSTLTKLTKVAPGSLIEVISEDRLGSGILMQELARLGQKVVKVEEDPLRNIRVFIERIY